MKTVSTLNRGREVEPEVMANFIYGFDNIDIWKANVKASLRHCGVTFKAFYPIILSNGIKMCRTRFYRTGHNKFPSFLYITTFSRLLGVPLHHLLNPNLPELLEAGVVKPSILGIHRTE